MEKIKNGIFEGHTVFSACQGLGLTPNDVNAVKTILEDCRCGDDLLEYGDDLKSYCSDYKYVVDDTITESKLLRDNEDLVVTDFLVNLAKGNFTKESNRIKVAPGELFNKAVNTSSGIQVSSEGYEATFLRTMQREVAARSYMYDLFSNKQRINSAKITQPYYEDLMDTSWIDAANYGTDKSTGDSWSELKLRDRTYKTFKLAMKSFVADETEEDSLISLAPILREAMVNSMVTEINSSFINGDGNGKPLGVLNYPNAPTINVTGKAFLQASAKGCAGRDLLRAVFTIDPKCRKAGTKPVIVASQQAISDLMGDEKFEDASQVGEKRASKRVGWVGNFYGYEVIQGDNDDFGWGNAIPKAGDVVAFAISEKMFTIFELRKMTSEYARNAAAQRDEYFMSTRINLEQTWYVADPNDATTKTKNAVCLIKHA